MTAAPRPAGPGPTSVSTHILDTSAGRPAEGVGVQLSVRDGDGGDWIAHGASSTDADGRCKNLPDLPEGTAQVRLRFEVGPYFARTAHHTPDNAEEQQDAPRARDSGPGHRTRGAFFPEVVITFAVDPGEHYHVPLLLNPYGYSVYRGS
jgi:5-hydroxyisourate hydrolase